MPNIASVLKAEIARVARKEARAVVEPLRKVQVAQRGELATLKRRASAAEQELKVLRKMKSDAPSQSVESTPRAVRFSAKGLMRQRQRLALSAEQVGALVGASGQSVYNWEAGTTRPRKSHLDAIGVLKTLGKKSAAAALEALRKDS